MTDYIFLMHGDAKADGGAWEPYLGKLKQGGFFEGGSAIGSGVCLRKSGPPAELSAHIVGFVKVKADSLHQAKSLVFGNPVFEAGGTVEIRELPHTN